MSFAADIGRLLPSARGLDEASRAPAQRALAPPRWPGDARCRLLAVGREHGELQQLTVELEARPDHAVASEPHVLAERLRRAPAARRGRGRLEEAGELPLARRLAVELLDRV